MYTKGNSWVKGLGIRVYLYVITMPKLSLLTEEEPSRIGIMGTRRAI